MDSLVPVLALLVNRSSVRSQAFQDTTRGDTLEATADRDTGLEQVHYLTCKSGGYEVSHDHTGRIHTIFVHIQPPRPGFQAFRGELVVGLRPGFTRKEVRGLLGKPTSAGKPWFDASFRRRIAWDRYDCEAFCLHVEYTGLELSIRMITLMAPDVAP